MKTHTSTIEQNKTCSSIRLTVAWSFSLKKKHTLGEREQEHTDVDRCRTCRLTETFYDTYENTHKDNQANQNIQLHTFKSQVSFFSYKKYCLNTIIKYRKFCQNLFINECSKKNFAKILELY